MEGSKKYAAIAALVIVIVAGIVWSVTRMGKPAPPAWRDQEELERIDYESLEIVTKPRGEWDKLEGKKAGTWENPATGKDTFVKVQTCGQCGEKIPSPAHLFPTDAEIRAMGGPESIAAVNEILSQYKCPHCGAPAGNARGGGGPRRGPGGPRR